MDGPAREVPEDLGIPKPWWQQPKRLLPLMLAAVLLFSVVGALAVTRLRPDPPARSVKPAPTRPPAPPTSTAPSAEGSGSIEPTPSADATERATPRGWVAFRLQGKLTVARDDGTGRKEVLPSAEGPFSLSPDGRTIALVDSASQALMLVDVASGTSRTIESAQGIRPSWSPDSQWVAYTAGSQAAGMVRTSSREGSVTVTVSAGHDPRVSADGRFVGFIAGVTGSQPGRLMLARLGEAPVPVAIGDAVAVAFTSSAMVYSTAPVTGEGSSVWVASVDGTSPSQLVPARMADPPAVYSSLFPSPRGDALMFAAVGDDGYSRVFSVPLAGGTPVALSPRYDGYPIGWSADGTRILFIEGNEFQGEPTNLMSVRPDGSGRRVLVRGASR